MDKYGKCKWFKKKELNISKKLPFYDVNKNKICNPFFDSINFYKSDDFNNNDFIYLDYDINNNDEIDRINKDRNKTIERINKIEDNKKQIIRLKELNTKTQKKLLQVNKITKTITTKINIDKKQRNIILGWMNECDKVYNLCVDMFNKKDKNFSYDYRKLKLVIFEKLYEENKKPCPYDILTDEVHKITSNLKSIFSNLKNKNIKHFNVKHISRINGRSILIPKKSINKDGFFITKLGKIKNFNIDIDNLNNDCRLVYDKIRDNFYLKCPYYRNKQKIEDRKKIVALDPGEKIFMTFYSPNNCGMIGNDFAKEILPHELKIRKHQRILSKNINKDGEKIKNKKGLKKKINDEYRKIKNKVKELHNKTSLYLVRNYERILLPSFETSKMVIDENKRKELKSKYIEKIKEARNNGTIKELTKKRRLGKHIRFMLNTLSFYKFKQHLRHKCDEYGCLLSIVSEEYTSQCCGKCGILSNEYKNREKECPKCHLKINRDINGSRNILIKNSKGHYKLRGI